VSIEIDLTPLIAALAELFPDVKPGPPPLCRECGSPEIRAKDLCPDCYWRWVHAGRPEFVPPRQRRPKRVGSQREDFLAARSLGATVPQAAKHARIPEHVGWRYDAADRGATDPAATYPAAS
jgi:hypothetical protein